MGFSRLYNYVRSLQLEGTFPQDAGCSIITGQRVSAGWGCIDETVWPYESFVKEGWPPPEPAGLDDSARRNRVPFYIRVRTLLECKAALANEWVPQVGFEITEDWADASGGEIPMPATGRPNVVGRHCVLLTGYDDSSARVRFQNSWGEGWGDRGFGSVSYDYFERFFQDGWLSMFPHNLRSTELYSTGEPRVNWSVPTPVGVLYGVELYDLERDIRRGWAFARQGTDRLDVEELFVRPDQRGNGVGAELCAALSKVSDFAKLPIRLWVPFIDDLSDVGAVNAIARRLGLTLRDSHVVWASRVAE